MKLKRFEFDEVH